MVERHLNPNRFEEIRILNLKDYNLAQIECIHEHKWYLSEERDAEVSFTEAAKDWVSCGLALEFRKYHIIKS